MIKIVFHTIRGRLTFWFLFLALIPLLVGIVIAYNMQKNTIESETFNKLTAVRDLKVRELNAWIDERIGDISIISEDLEIRSLENVFETMSQKLCKRNFV